MKERIVKDGTKIVVPGNREALSLDTMKNVVSSITSTISKERMVKKGDKEGLMRDSFIIVPIKFINLT